LNTTGINNTANGVNALYNNTTANHNTANGVYALFSNTIGSGNTATGAFAVRDNTSGGGNTATGIGALVSNTTGNSNTATDNGALFNNTIGDDNTATGAEALAHNTIGSGNTADGFFALFGNSTGSDNTAIGYSTLEVNNGSDNTAIGIFALTFNNGNGNTAVGSGALIGNSTGSFNTALGQNAGQGLVGGESNNIDIGYNVLGVTGESNTIRIGNTDITDTFITGISGTTVASGAAVLVDSDGHLGTVTSSKRFKEEIRPMNKTSEAIFSLEPVTFRYKKEVDPAGTSQFGLVAEKMDQVNRDLVVRDKEGKPYSVRYEAVNAMLLNEFLKEHRKVERLEATVVSLAATVKEQALQLQQVSAEVGINKPAAKVVSTNP
jgi:hypothetical protein